MRGVVRLFGIFAGWMAIIGGLGQLTEAVLLRNGDTSLDALAMLASGIAVLALARRQGEKAPDSL